MYFLVFFSIFEDDVILSKDSNFFLSHSDWIPMMKDTIIKLEAFPIKVALKNKIAEINHRKLFKLDQSYVGAAGYILDLSTARKILSLIEALSSEHILPIDEILFNTLILNQKINVVQMIPAICIQEQFYNKQSKLTSQLEYDREKNKTLDTKLQNNIKKTVFERLTKEISRIFDKKRKVIFK